MLVILAPSRIVCISLTGVGFYVGAHAAFPSRTAHKVPLGGHLSYCRIAPAARGSLRRRQTLSASTFPSLPHPTKPKDPTCNPFLSGRCLRGLRAFDVNTRILLTLRKPRSFLREKNFFFLRNKILKLVEIIM